MLDRLNRAIAEYRENRLSAEELCRCLERELESSPGELEAIRTALATLGDRLPAAARERLNRPRATRAASAPGADDAATRFRGAPSVPPPPAEPSLASEPPLSAPTSAPTGSAPSAPRSADSAPASAPHAPAEVPLPPPVAEALAGPGRVLGGHYRLVREIGHGGMGSVYLAEGIADGERYAVKILGAEFREHPDAIRALREEARKSLALRHPNIVAVYPLERDGPNYYLPMEFLDGKTLRALLDEDFVRGMPLLQAWSIIRGVGAALAYAHDRGVIHSDLKPSNVFVTIGGSARVLDFGIARALRGDRGRFDAGTLGALTEAYASCEMLEGSPPDFQDDVYGFACVVYELLTGRHPFGGRSATAARDGHLSAAPIAGLTDSQNAALRRGLAFRREERCASVEEFLRVWDEVAPRSKITPGARRRPTATLVWIGAAVLIGALAVVVIALLGPPGGLLTPSATRAPGVERTPAQPAAAPRSALLVPAPQAAAALGLPGAGQQFRDCADCPLMVVLPAGQFRMSSSKEEPGRGPNELPQRLVNFPERFAISAFPVTRGQFRGFLRSTGRRPGGHCGDAPQAGHAALNFEDPGFFQSDQDPAVCVSLGDALAYSDWLGEQKVGHGASYRLPTEAEWEYAARAGARSAYAWGDTEADACRFGNFGDRRYFAAARPDLAQALCDDGYRYTAPVGRFPKSRFGLWDTVGNVLEWTLSCLHEAPPGADDGSASVDCPRNAMVPAVRGAGFKTLLGQGTTRVAWRFPLAPATPMTDDDIGFRVVRAR